MLIVFLFACDLIIPIIILLFGIRVTKHEPKNINGVYGYRTTRSMKNQETWKFANQYCGILWRKLGSIMLIISIVIAAIATRLNDNTEALVCGVLVTIQTVALVASIFPVEKALRENFDENGNKK